jgi:hypothetical protein
MKWEYKVSLFLLLLSQIVFLGLAAYHTEVGLISGTRAVSPTAGYSWIWYHMEQWIISLFLSVLALVFFVYGVITEIKPYWKLKFH